MTTALSTIFWLMAALALLVICWRACGLLGARDPLPRRMARVIVLAWAAIAATALLANLTGMLNAPVLLCGPPVVAACMAWIAVEYHRRHPLAAEGQVYAVAVSSDRDQWPQAAVGETVVWAIGAAAAAAIIVRRGLLTFPRDWDTLAYHLPLIDHWLRDGSLYAPACAFWYVPGNNELLGLWIVAPFSGDFLIGLNNLAPVALLTFGIYALAVEFTARRWLPTLAAVAVVVSQPVGRQMFSAENDVAVAALVVAAMLFGVRYVRMSNLLDALTCALSIGLLAGTKYYALGYAAAVMAALLTGVFARRGCRSALLFLGLCGVSLIGFASYWYIRNWWWGGAPLFPKSFGGDADLWSQMRPGVEKSSLLRSGRSVVWPMYVDALRTNSGPLGLASLVAALIWGIVGVVAGIRWRALLLRQDTPVASSLPPVDTRGLMLSISAGISALVLGMTPNLVETAPETLNMIRGGYLPARFSLTLIALGAVAAVYLLSKAVQALAVSRIGRALKPRTVHILSAVATGGLCLWQAIDQVRTVVDVDWTSLAVANGALLAGAVALWRAPWRLRRRRLVYSALAVMVIAGIGLGVRQLEIRWRQGFARDYAQMFRCLPRLPERPGRICVCDYRYYPWLGAQRQRNVSRPLYVPDYAALDEHLRRFRSTLIVTVKEDRAPQQRYAEVANWVRLHPGRFTVVYEDRKHLIARVRWSKNSDPALTATQPGGME